MLRSLMLFMLLSFTFICSQTGSLVTIAPEKPKLTDVVHITFQPGKDSPLLNADTVLFQGKFYTPDRKSLLNEFVMTKTSAGYELNLDLNGKDFNCVVFQFAGKTGEPLDCNNEKAWEFLIFDQRGNALKYAYYNLSESFKAWPYPLKRERNNKAQLKYLEEEYKRYPKDFYVNYSLVLLKNQLKAPFEVNVTTAQTQIDSLLSADPENIKHINTALNFYNAIGNKEKYTSLLTTAAKLNKTKILSERRNKTFVMADKKAKLDTILSIYRKAKGTDLESALTQDILMTPPGVVSLDRYLEITKDLKNPDMETCILQLCGFSDEGGTKLLNAKETNDPKQKTYYKEMDKIETNLLNVLTAYTNDKDIRSWDNFPSRKQYARRRAIGIGFIALTKAEYSKGNYEQSIQYFKSAEKLIPNDGYFYHNAVAPYVKSTIESSLKKRGDNKPNLSFAAKLNGKDDRIKQAVFYALDILDKEYDNELAKLIIQIDSKLSVKSEALTSRLKSIRNRQKTERTNEVHTGYKKNFTDAPDFIVYNFDGKKVRLADLKGKIVILDFWATTCGYCLQSFKYLEKFYAVHKNDNDIFVGAINLDLEVGNSSKEKDLFVADFLKKHKFNLNFLMDYGNTTSPLYQITGIPVIVIIGPGGKIYFREDGFGGPTLAEDIEYIVDRIRKEKI
jgi:thiol-disulfide isomerase/thioredoxin